MTTHGLPRVVTELPLAGPNRPALLVLPGEPLPLRDVPAPLKELDRCVEKLGMKGLLRDTNRAGKFRDAPEPRPMFRRAADTPGGFGYRLSAIGFPPAAGRRLAVEGGAG